MSFASHIGVEGDIGEWNKVTAHDLTGTGTDHFCLILMEQDGVGTAPIRVWSLIEAEVHKNERRSQKKIWSF